MKGGAAQADFIVNVGFRTKRNPEHIDGKQANGRLDH
jgi:hypothetical protein